ncbi:carboxypeptidase-like regulatory domain-containing protein [Psychroserpens luteus]|uniref:Carboxypeptidase-like regulatory domain-containing protein n=1 Tax=Psychroserpens luteus TaxID=1434066 RepID=A0ABW5ZYD5_9FLAO|nr:carboxypeptidase-like regulatory domain-containing protein [Psychroserpens luteus]
MRATLNINIPEPCHEDWSKMTVQEKGRHCASCEKTVYDFTTKTDEQIVRTYLDEGKVCGRFKSTQLNRELVLTRKEKNNYLSYVASTLFAFLSFGTQDVEAQGKPRIVNVDSLKQPNVNGKPATSILNIKAIHGTIYNSDKFPIPNAIITIKGNGISTISTEDGSFAIKGTLETILLIKAAGYETAEITIRDFGTRQIYLKSQTNEKVTSVIPVCVITATKTETVHSILGGIAGYPVITTNTKKENPLPIVNGNLDRSTSGAFLYSMRHMFNRKN